MDKYVQINTHTTIYKHTHITITIYIDIYILHRHTHTIQLSNKRQEEKLHLQGASPRKKRYPQ